LKRNVKPGYNLLYDSVHIGVVPRLLSWFYTEIRHKSIRNPDIILTIRI